MTINNYPKILTRRALDSEINTILLEGPEGVGKLSFLRSLINEKEIYFDTIELNSRSKLDDYRNINRDILEIIGNKPATLVILTGLEDASDTQKDSLLKLVEEPVSGIKIIAVSHHPEMMGIPLLSRFRLRIKWDSYPIKMQGKTDRDWILTKISNGSQSILESVSNDSGLISFYDILIKKEWPQIAISSPFPDVLNLKNVTPERKIALANLFRLASRSSAYQTSFLDISNYILKTKPSSISQKYMASAISCL